MVKQKHNRLEKWFIPSVVLSGIGLMAISLMNNPIGVFMNGIAAMIGINLPTISATLITYGVLNKVMLLLSARASREIVNAVDTNTKTFKSEIGDVKEALKSIENKIDGQTTALKSIENKIDGQTTALKSIKNKIGRQTATLKRLEGKADGKTDTTKQA